MKNSKPATLNYKAYSQSGAALEWGRISKDLGIFPGERAVINRIKDKIAGTSTLDIGVGAGRTTPIMLELTSDYLGIDWSEAMIAACRASFPAVRFLQCDARTMEVLGSERYGFVWFSFNGLDYVDHEERQLILYQIFRVLRAGGLFFFSSHNVEARREKPWDLGLYLYKWSWKPVVLLKTLGRMLRAIWNYVRYRSLQTEHRDYAIRLDSNGHFGLPTYYVNPEVQMRMLKYLGFVDIETMDWSGQSYLPSHERVRTAAHVYYLARKPAQSAQ